MNVLDFVKKVWSSFTSKVSEVGKALGLVGATVGATVMSTPAQAAIVAPTFDSADAITVGTAVLTGLALIWAIKQAMRLAR